MKILVLGGSGLVGSRFIELYADKYEFSTPKSPEFDLINLESVKSYSNKHNFEIVVNFAAYTDVTQAETQRNDKNGECWKVNVLGIQNLVQVFSDKHLIQISTDMLD